MAMTILVVDDSLTMLMSLKATLIWAAFAWRLPTTVKRRWTS